MKTGCRRHVVIGHFDPTVVSVCVRFVGKLLSNILLNLDEELRCGMSAVSAEWPTGKGMIKVEASISLLQAVETDASPSEKLVAEAA